MGTSASQQTKTVSSLTSNRMEPSNIDVDVLIVGAGLTGLGVARHLVQHQKKPSFVILEARDRIGGRIHTVKTSDGASVEMGATWFFPPFRNMFKLLKELKVELGEQFMKGYIMYDQGRGSPPSKSYSTGDDDDMFRIKGGTKRVIDALYSAIGDEDKIKLSSVVTSITSEGGVVSVGVKDGDGNDIKVWRARYVVTTVPPQLLANTVTFSPALPDSSLNIMKNTHTWMGDSTKGAATFANPFWRDKDLAGALYSNSGPFIQMYDQCGHDDDNHAALVGFMSDDIESLSKEQRKEAVKEQLSKVFGEEAGKMLDYTDTVWAQEQWTVWGGGKVRLRRHQHNGHQVYQDPLMEGRLIVAGTETSPVSGGYMEGAVNSAQHVKTLLDKVL